MTNEEIEKRFLFDLEMGVFKTSSYDYFHIKSDENAIAFIEYYRRSTENVAKIMYILRKNGFKVDRYTSDSFRDLDDDSRAIIVIGRQRKLFTKIICDISVSYKELVGSYCNKIPDYIKEYKL